LDHAAKIDERGGRVEQGEKAEKAVKWKGSSIVPLLPLPPFLPCTPSLYIRISEIKICNPMALNWNILRTLPSRIALKKA